MILLGLAGCGQEYPAVPTLDIPNWTCHRRKKREREGEGDMLGCYFIWLKEDLEAGRENTAMMVTVKQEGLEKFIELLLSLINLINLF